MSPVNFKALLTVIARHKAFVVATHVNPDPDALASQLSVATWLRALGKKVTLLAEEEVPLRYRFMAGAPSVKKANLKKIYPCDAVVIVDCGDLKRIGEVRRVLPPDAALINIDHHVTNDRFGKVNIVVPDASSTCEIIYDLYRSSGVALTRMVAGLLYLGIMTDTGSFRYENTTSRTFAVASELMRFRLPVAEFYRRIYETVPSKDLARFAKVIAGFRSSFEGRVLDIALSKRTVDSFSGEFDLRDKIFQYLRSIKGAEVFVIFTEQNKGRTRINLRSQSFVDVARLASRFEGGGHRRASGCVINEGLSRARVTFLNEIKKELRKS